MKYICLFCFQSLIRSWRCFLDISKAFDRAWHEGLIYKTKCMAVKGDLLTLIKYFLFERQRRVVLNGQESDNQTWCASRLISLVHYFLIYINDLSGNLKANVKLFADDSSIFSVVSDRINTSQKLNKDLDKVVLWVNKWEMSSNTDPSKQAQEITFFIEDNQRISIIN